MFSDDDVVCTGMVMQPHFEHVVDDQAAARPTQRRQLRRFGYARTSSSQADLRQAVGELQQLGVESEHSYIDRGLRLRAAKRPGLPLLLHACVGAACHRRERWSTNGGFDPAQGTSLDRSQGGNDQALEQLAVLLPGARCSIALGHAALRIPRQRFQLGAALRERWLHVPCVNAHAPRRAKTGVDPRREGVRSLITLTIRSYVASPVGAAAQFDAAEGTPLSGHLTHFIRSSVTNEEIPLTRGYAIPNTTRWG